MSVVVALRLPSAGVERLHAALVGQFVLGGASEAGGAAAYASPLDVIRKTVATEGVRGVYNGGTANYLRFGPYCVLVFVFVERARQVEAYAMEKWRG